MSNLTISTRYAKALMSLALEKEAFEKVNEDMQLVLNTLTNSKELRNALKSPIIKAPQKSDILKGVFEVHLTGITNNFLAFLVQKNRQDYLFDISKRYNELKNQKLNIVEAEVFSSTEFSDAQLGNLKAKLEETTKKKVLINYSKMDDILGGFLIKIDDTMIDATINNQLEMLRKQLMENPQQLKN